VADPENLGGRVPRRGRGASGPVQAKHGVPESGKGVRTAESSDDQLMRSREQLQTLSRRLITAQETERQRIARELHDEIGGSLSAIKMNLQSLRRTVGVPALVAQLHESIEVVEQTLRRVRDLSVALRPSLLDDLGLVPALRWYVDRQSQRGGLRCTFEADEAIEPPAEVQTASFRIAQEALTNVVRHAGARSVDVGLRRAGDCLELTVTDDGRGFDVKLAVGRIGADASLGLLGMRERARLLGGRVTIESTLRKGTTVRARIPLAGVPSR
jgi:signal transduction histidine kinase